MVDDIVLNKSAIIERCIARIHDEYRDIGSALETDFTRQDAIILHLLRCCEAAIDMAMHVAKTNQLGLPQSSRHAFELLHESSLIDESLMLNMQRMVGFRNIAVHEYQKMDLTILRNIVERQLKDFQGFVQTLLTR